MVDQDELEFAVSHQVSPQQEGETALKYLEARDRVLLPRDVHAVRHFLSLQACFIHVEDLLGLVPSLLLDNVPEMIWVGSSGIFIGSLGLFQALYIMKPIADLKVVKAAHADVEFWYGARLLLLQVAEAFHGRRLRVIKVTFRP